MTQIDITTYLDKQRLLDHLEQRITELAGYRTPAGDYKGNELADLKRAIDAGAYDAINPIFDTDAAPVQDPLEAAADRIIGTSGFTDVVRELPVGDITSVQTILYRRADEHEKQAAVIRERRAQMAEAVQGLLSAEWKGEGPMEREPDKSDDARDETPATDRTSARWQRCYEQVLREGYVGDAAKRITDVRFDAGWGID